MATVKTNAPGPSSEAARYQFSIAEALDGPRPGRDDPDADKVWRRLRSDLDAATMMHPEFDLRHVLHLEGARLHEWQAARRRWLREQFRGDPRIRPEP